MKTKILTILVMMSNTLSLYASLPHDNRNLTYADRLLFWGIEKDSHEDIERALTAGNANINTYDPITQKSPLDRIIEKKLFGAARYLLKNGADLSINKHHSSSNYSKILEKKHLAFIPFFLQMKVPYLQGKSKKIGESTDIEAIKKKDLKRLMDAGKYKKLSLMFRHGIFKKNDMNTELRAYGLDKDAPLETQHFCKDLFKDSTCTICLENVEPFTKETRLTKCRHWFHANCLKEWLKQKNECAYCRTKNPF